MRQQKKMTSCIYSQVIGADFGEEWQEKWSFVDLIKNSAFMHVEKKTWTPKYLRFTTVACGVLDLTRVNELMNNWKTLHDRHLTD